MQIDTVLVRLRATTIQTVNPDLRRGTALFFALNEVAPQAASKIRRTFNDPYHYDSRIPAFWEAIYEMTHDGWVID